MPLRRTVWILGFSAACLAVVACTGERVHAQSSTVVGPPSPGGQSPSTSAAGPASPSSARVGPLQAGVPWPASFRPYGSASPWNREISNQTKPVLVPGSDAIIAHAMPSISDGQQLRVIDMDLGNGEQYHDYAHPWFVAQNADPQVNVVCTQYCSDKITKMRIPAKARPGNSGDAHITVIQPDGEAIDTWGTTWPSADWTNGATMTSKTVTDCGNFFSGSGTSADGYTSTVAGFCNQAGTINYNEAFNGIHHALFLLVKCGNTKSFRYPAHNYFDTPCTDGQPGFVSGDHVWLDLNDAQIDALSGLPGTANDAIWQRNVLKALHHYGGYIGDHGYDDSHAGAPQILLEDSGSYTALGLTAPWQTYAKANGWTLNIYGTAQVWTFADPWNPLDDARVGGWRAHLHIIDPCYAKGTC